MMKTKLTRRLGSIGLMAFLFAIANATGLLHAQDSLEKQLLSESPERLLDQSMEVGDAKRGALIYFQPYLACAKCHEPTEGGSLGPDLSKWASSDSDVTLVEALLVPSKRIREGYQATIVRTEDGEVISGIVRSENDSSLQLQRLDGAMQMVEISKSGIEERSSPESSLMPAGQVNQLKSRSEFLDLLRYLLEIKRGGKERADQLRPSASQLVLKVPEYESRIDHRAMLSDWKNPSLARESFSRGEKIYQRLCVNCHGTKDEPGSLPTSLRFASGKFKNGKDPLAMYKTLTYGFAMMAPQGWMVPQQKYDVIHYIRQEYLAKHNRGEWVDISEDYLKQLPVGDTRGPEPSQIEPWSQMNYGPFLTGTIEIESGGERKKGELPNIAYKGIAMRVDSGVGGVAQGNQWQMFEHDTLRMAAGWSWDSSSPKDRFIDWHSIHFDGQHQVHPRGVGKLIYTTPNGPGWSIGKLEGFEDQRITGRDGRRYGPMPRNWGRYQGIHLFGDRQVLSYRVGETPVLELPGMLGDSTSPLLTRQLRIAPRAKDLYMMVAAHPASASSVPRLEIIQGALREGESSSGDVAVLKIDRDRVASEKGQIFSKGARGLVAKSDKIDVVSKDFSFSARILTQGEGTIVSYAAPEGNWVPNGKTLFVSDGHLVFDIGWIGAVRGQSEINDGEWHDVAVIYQASTGKVVLMVDGREDAKGVLRTDKGVAEGVIQVGYTSRNFPRPDDFFEGSMAAVRIDQRLIQASELGELLDEVVQKPSAAQATAQALASWNLAELNTQKKDRQQSDQQTIEGPERSTVRDTSGHEHSLELQLMNGASEPVEDAALVAMLAGDSDGLQWQQRSDGVLVLKIPAGEETLEFSIGICLKPNMALDAVAEMQQFLSTTLTQVSQQASTQVNIEQMLHGGPPRWQEVLSSPVVRGNAEGPFAVDALTPPSNNPWFAQMRLSGIDFLPGGDRAIVCSWDGDVWLVSGLSTIDTAIDGETRTLNWQRIASGLFQPLGIKWIDGKVIVTCRDQLVRLHDLNGDQEADFYECFNNDQQVTEHFHEFAMGLQVDSDGNLYYAKSARHALRAVVPQHGTLLKVSPDGQTTEILANGFRAANGVCLNPDGSFVVTDQEGHWNPKNRINWVVPPAPGQEPRFYGNMFGYHDVTDASDQRMEPPLCWITNRFDRSPAELLWVPEGVWSPISNRLLNLSYGEGKIFLVPHERVDGKVQGGMIALPVEGFPTGVMRGRFHPTDGGLYVCGMFAWAGNATEPGGLYRIRRSAKKLNVPVEINASKGAITLQFTENISPESVKEINRVTVRVWDLKRSQNYGSEHINERTLAVEKIEVLTDKKSVRIVIPELAPTWGMSIQYRFADEQGEVVEGEIHNTIHELAP